jgi:hypothetical protein
MSNFNFSAYFHNFVNMFWNPIFIFYLDKQHLVRVEKLLYVLVHTHVSVGAFARIPFSPIPSGGFYEFGALMDAWPYCPGPKVEKCFSTLPFLLQDREINSYIVRLLRIIPDRLLLLPVLLTQLG